MKLGLVGPSYQERSLPFDAQRTINLFPVIDETTQGKEVAALYGTPGLSLFSTAGIGPIRASFTSANSGRSFVISGAGLYEITSDGISTLLGNLATSTSICFMSENVTQLAICDGNNFYILTYSSNVLAKISSPNPPLLAASSLTQQDQYFIVSRLSSGRFFISAIADGTTWSSLDFATAESSPDDLVVVFSAYGQLWLFGTLTTEVWYNSAGVDFPFTRVEGAKIQVGCAAAASVVGMDNSIYWLGNDKDGTGIVYMADGYTAKRVSTTAIERLISAVPDLTQLRAYSYQEGGHLFYVLTGNGLATTLVYDVSTKQWHERAYLEANGTLSIHRAVTHTVAFGKHLVGDKENGNIYEMSLDFYDDNGDEIFRQRTFVHVHDENKRFKVSEIQVDFEAGVGLTSGQGSDPIAILEVSNDGGKTWSPEYFKSIGAIGAFKARATWRRLGLFDLMTARITITDPVKVAICGAYMK